MPFDRPILALALGALFAAATSANASRVNGSYTSLITRDATACARACADDGICMAWIRHADGACELLATAPIAAAPREAEVGIAARAPSFVAWPKPELAAEEPIVALTVSAPPVDEPTADEPATEATMALLGGPEDEALRPRLGTR